MANCKVILDLIGEKKKKKRKTKTQAKVTVLCSRKLQVFGGERHIKELTQQSFRRLMLNTYVSLLEENQEFSGSNKVPALLQPLSRIQKIHSIVYEDY